MDKTTINDVLSRTADMRGYHGGSYKLADKTRKQRREEKTWTDATRL